MTLNRCLSSLIPKLQTVYVHFSSSLPLYPFLNFLKLISLICSSQPWSKSMVKSQTKSSDFQINTETLRVSTKW